MTRVITLVMTILVVSASAADAQSWDVSAMAGYTLPAELDQAARGVESTSVAGGINWQIATGRNFNPRWGAELLWGQQFASYNVESGGTTGTLFEMTIMQLQGNLLYSFAPTGSRLQPYVLAGLGSTFFSATDLQSETKFSMGFGGGVKMFVKDAIGIRGQFRYTPTFLNDSDATDFCDPFGFCQSVLGQFEITGGVTFRF